MTHDATTAARLFGTLYAKATAAQIRTLRNSIEDAGDALELADVDAANASVSNRCNYGRHDETL